MTWTRLDDHWTEQKAIADLSLAARWHYLCLIQLCSRSDRYDGVVRMVDSLRCSDVEDPKVAMNEIHQAGLVKRIDDRSIVLVFIDQHVPPPSVRKKAESDRVRKQRQRLHEAGDHSTCYRQRCDLGVLDEPEPRRQSRDMSRVTVTPEPSEQASHVQSPVTSHVTPGRDGTGQDGTGSTEREVIDTTTGEVLSFDDRWSSGNPTCKSKGCDEPLINPESRASGLCPRHSRTEGKVA